MRTGAPISLCLALLPGALGLRFPGNGTAVALAEEVETGAWRYERVPDIRQFREVWTARYNMETHLQEPLPSSIQLVLGLMTIAVDGEYRQVVRRTWLRQAGVCYWRATPQKNCSVYAAFVIGKSGTGSKTANLTDAELAKIHREAGMLVLDTAENLMAGKSFLWLVTALEMFPWATHIGKMDMDTYPFLHKLVYRMELNRHCAGEDGPYEFIGRPDDYCWDAKACRRSFRNACPSGACAAQFVAGGETVPLDGTWRFLAGELYILSLPLVQKVRWNTTKFGNEDIMITKAVDYAAFQQQFCVSLRRPAAWYHRTLESDPAFANNF